MAKAPHPGERGVEPGKPIRAAGITPAPSVGPDRTLQPAE
jgi:cytochrome bd ubiquinol oxidase subunit I